MKKGLYLAIFAVLGVLLLLPGMALSAFAAPARTTATALKSAARSAAGARPGWIWGWDHSVQGWWSPNHHFYPQENNQYFHGSSNSGNFEHFMGHDLGNTGNQGHNRNVNQDNSLNGGNQLVNQGKRRGYRRNNQHYWGRANDDNTLIYEGHNEGNSGNQGLNDGINQDNGTNAGNQIIN